MAAIGTGSPARPLSTSQPKSGPSARGLAIEAAFCPPEVDPFDTVEWELRTAAIKGEGGEVLFEQTDCEIPPSGANWPPTSSCSKYFYGEVGTPRARDRASAS